MFDYLFKRPVNSPQSSPEPHSGAGAQTPNRDKENAVQVAKSLDGDEAAAVEFLLQCPFADARLIAAEYVHAKDLLERALPAMRNVDRRVSRLMQARLDALTFERQSEHLAQRCVDRALQLADEPLLLANQVVDLDHAWQATGAPSTALHAAFDHARAVLRERLEAQAELQRAVMDNLARLCALPGLADGMSPAELESSIEQVEQQMALHLASREAPSLPKHLLAEFSAQQQLFKTRLGSLHQRLAAIQVRQELLQQWESADPQAGLNARDMRRAWQALPPLPDADLNAALQSRFDALVSGKEPADEAASEDAQAAQGGRVKATQDISDVLDAMESALRQGALHAASELDRQLREQFNDKPTGDKQASDKPVQDKQARGKTPRLRLSTEQSARLANVRAELSRLQAWAKWGGNVSREELLKAAEGLPAQSLPPSDLAKQVGALRDHWKSLDASAGAARKELWERFDAACSLAYAPAAAHFKKLADERKANLTKAEVLVAELRQFSAASHVADDHTAPDWKAIVSFCSHAELAWKRLGNIDRKDKKRLDGEFRQAMNVLQQALTVQQQTEAARRENLIAQALALKPTDRGALDAIRTLQERWQHMAKTAPLERKDEQKLWKKFRAACDTLFDKRKEAAAGADAERKRNLSEKESVCATLESAPGDSAAAISKIVQEAKEAWHRIGFVPRAAEKQIEARFHAALAALQKRLDAARRAVADSELHALLGKIRLCRALEQRLAEGAEPGTATLEQWQALPALPNEFERGLRARWDKAMQAVQAGDGQYRAVLEKNRIVLQQQLLRLEIVAGLDSPAGLARERMQMQVDVLRSTLKSGPATNKREMLLELCKLAAVADDQTVVRFERLVGKLKNMV